MYRSIEPALTPRRARQEEAPVVAALWLRSRRASIPAIPPMVHDDDDVCRWFATVVLPQRETWVIEDQGIVVALLVMQPGWIDQLYVDPDRLDAGLGSLLVDVAKRRHPCGLDLWTFQSNLRARRFYERHGFVAVATTDDDNEEGEPDVRYHWPGG